MRRECLGLQCEPTCPVIDRFFDPSVNFGLQFDTDGVATEAQPTVLPGIGESMETSDAAPAEPAEGTVVSLDAFRRK